MLAGLARAAVSDWMPLVVIAASATVFGAAYLLSVWWLGVLTSEEHLAIRQRGRRLLARCGIGARPPATIGSGTK